MEWHDEGIVLSARKYGESSAIATLLTKEHGRHSGLVHGGGTKNKQGILQPGNFVNVRWKARLVEHLGIFSPEIISSYSAPLLSRPNQLGALLSACTLSETALPDRQPHQNIYNALKLLLHNLTTDFWPNIYIKWELGLLASLGFGLDLSKCAVTGTTIELTHVSPKSGKAVSLMAAQPYIEKLLPLPAFLLEDAKIATKEEILEALTLTGYFLQNHVFLHRPKGLPNARKRLVEMLA